MPKGVYKRKKVNIKIRLKKYFTEGNYNDCWLWQGYLEKNGYGRIVKDGGKKLAHRVVYELFRGPIPEGLELDHLCKRRNCVNPNNLEPVSHKENVLRGDSFSAKNARKTHCDVCGNELEQYYSQRRCIKCVKEYYQNNIEKIKDYQRENKEKLKEYKKEYRLKNKTQNLIN